MKEEELVDRPITTEKSGLSFSSKISFNQLKEKQNPDRPIKAEKSGLGVSSKIPYDQMKEEEIAHRPIKINKNDLGLSSKIPYDQMMNEEEEEGTDNPSVKNGSTEKDYDVEESNGINNPLYTEMNRE